MSRPFVLWAAAAAAVAVGLAVGVGPAGAAAAPLAAPGAEPLAGPRMLDGASQQAGFAAPRGAVGTVGTVGTEATTLPIVSRRLWIVPAYWGSAPSSAYRQNLATRAKSAAAFYRQESLDRYRLTVMPVRPSIKVRPYSQCASDAAQAAARRSLGSLFRPSTDFIVTALPAKSDCGFAGFAMTPGPALWVSSWATPGPLAHELGHAMFGFGHDGALRCTTGGAPSTFGLDCESLEYGNPYSVMGSAPYMAPIAGRSIIGGLTAADLVVAGLRPRSNARLLATTSTVRLYARATAAAPTTYVVPWFFSPAYSNVPLVLEYRVPVGADFWLDKVRDGNGVPSPGGGVLVTTGPSPYATSASSSYVGGGLLDLHPDSGSAFNGGYRPGLSAGESFTTPNGAVTLTVLETTSEYAKVRVQRNIPDTRAPSVKLFAPDVERIDGRRYATVSWTAADNVAIRSAGVVLDARAPVVRGAGNPLWSSPAVDGSVRFSVAKGWHKVSVTVTDFAGNRRTVTKSFLVA